jgi:hypothetical protein
LLGINGRGREENGQKKNQRQRDQRQWQNWMAKVEHHWPRGKRMR